MKKLFTGPDAHSIIRNLYPQIWEIINGPDFPLISEHAVDLETKTAFFLTTKNWLEGGSIQAVFFQQIASLPGLHKVNTNVTGHARYIEIIVNL